MLEETVNPMVYYCDIFYLLNTTETEKVVIKMLPLVIRSEQQAR